MTQPPQGDALPEQTPPAEPQAPQQWAWAQPQQRFVQTQTEPLEYHRLYRGAQNYAWWKPLVAVLLGVSIYFAFNIGYSFALVPLLSVYDPEYLNTLFLNNGDLLDTQHPWSIVLNMGAIILMIPATLLAMLILGIRPVGRIWSVAGRVRWGLLGKTALAALVAIIVMNGVGILLDVIASMWVTASDTTPANQDPDFSVSAAITSMVLVLFLVPFQAAAEEVVFRGAFLQVLGSWMRSPWIAIGISTVAFAAGHIYDIWGLLAVGIMGLVAAWLTWKTGGLEAAIAIHILNNFAAFGVMASGFDSETAQAESGGGLASLIAEVVGLALFAWLTLRIFKRGGYGRERIDTVLRAVPIAPLQAATPNAAAPEGQEPRA